MPVGQTVLEWYLAYVAEAYGYAGQSESGLATLAEAMTITWPQLGARNVSPQRRTLTPAVIQITPPKPKPVSTKPSPSPTTKGQILGTARRHQPGPPVAVAGQAPGGVRDAGAGVRVVYGGV